MLRFFSATEEVTAEANLFAWRRTPLSLCTGPALRPTVQPPGPQARADFEQGSFSPQEHEGGLTVERRTEGNEQQEGRELGLKDSTGCKVLTSNTADLGSIPRRE